MLVILFNLTILKIRQIKKEKAIMTIELAEKVKQTFIKQAQYLKIENLEKACKDLAFQVKGQTKEQFWPHIDEEFKHLFYFTIFSLSRQCKLSASFFSRMQRNCR
jgi:hypothetical protein